MAIETSEELVQLTFSLIPPNLVFVSVGYHSFAQDYLFRVIRHRWFSPMLFLYDVTTFRYYIKYPGNNFENYIWLKSEDEID